MDIYFADKDFFNAECSRQIVSKLIGYVILCVSLCVSCAFSNSNQDLVIGNKGKKGLVYDNNKTRIRNLYYPKYMNG